MPISWPAQIEMLIVRCKQDKPHWGAPRIRERLPGFIRMSTPRRPDSGVPQRPRPAPDAHASLLKLPPPSNYFLCRDPGAGFAPSCLVNAP